MINLDDYRNKTQEQILVAIKEKSRLIAIQQQKADKSGFKNYDGAIGLQRLRIERDMLKTLLQPLTLIINLD